MLLIFCKIARKYVPFLRDVTELYGIMSELQDIATRLDTLEDVAVIRFTNEDVVRHPSDNP